MAHELFLVKLEYKSGVVGGASMMLQLTADSASGSLNGPANGTIQEGTPQPREFTASASGHTYSTGLGSVTKVGAVSGQAVVSRAPAIGSYLAPFSASFSVDKQWNGTGKFSLGNDTYECKVTNNG